MLPQKKTEIDEPIINIQTKTNGIIKFQIVNNNSSPLIISQIEVTQKTVETGNSPLMSNDDSVIIEKRINLGKAQYTKDQDSFFKSDDDNLITIISNRTGAFKIEICGIIPPKNVKFGTHDTAYIAGIVQDLPKIYLEITYNSRQDGSEKKKRVLIDNIYNIGSSKNCNL